MARETYMENGVEMCGPGYTKEMYDVETNAENFPVKVMLRFENEADKQNFLGGLCDSWGENECSLHWKWLDGEQLHTAEELTVTVFNYEKDDTDDE